MLLLACFFYYKSNRTAFQVLALFRFGRFLCIILSLIRHVFLLIFSVPIKVQTFANRSRRSAMIFFSNLEI